MRDQRIHAARADSRAPWRVVVFALAAALVGHALLLAQTDAAAHRSHQGPTAAPSFQADPVTKWKVADSPAEGQRCWSVRPLARLWSEGNEVPVGEPAIIQNRERVDRAIPFGPADSQITLTLAPGVRRALLQVFLI